MVDRQELREKAKGIGSSVAGTFKKGAKAAKEGAKSFADTTKEGASNIKSDVTGGEQEVEVFYNQEADKYLLYVDGEPVDQFDSEMQAKAAAREIQREEETDGATGRFQQFATSFAEGVNETVTSAAEGPDDADEKKEAATSLLTGGGMDETGGPELAFLGDPDNDNDPEFAFMGNTDGDRQPEMALFERNQDADAPTLPGFGESPDADDVTLPGFGDPDEGSQPMVPAFAATNNNGERDPEERFPWMF